MAWCAQDVGTSSEMPEPLSTYPLSHDEDRSRIGWQYSFGPSRASGLESEFAFVGFGISLSLDPALDAMITICAAFTSLTDVSSSFYFLVFSLLPE